MSSNSFGKLFTLTTFGESHGTAIGGIIDGCPPGLTLSTDFIQAMLDRRKPGQSHLTSPRKESDRVEILSGMFEGKTTGAPIGFLIQNNNVRSEDYGHLRDAYRPSHADFTYQQKYGVRDHRGGGRSSARETASWVVGGAVALQLLQHWGVSVHAFVSAVAGEKLTASYRDLDLTAVDASPVRCPDPESAGRMEKLIEDARREGDSLGGIITCVAMHVPPGLGAPVFDKLNADLGKAMLSINAVKGFELGSGFDGTKMKGSEHNDIFIKDPSGKVITESNHSGGIQGGISNGQDIVFNVAFKPVATIMKDQRSVDGEGNEIVLEGKGRHDPCVLPRAVPVVEAMTAMVLADHLLRHEPVKALLR